MSQDTDNKAARILDARLLGDPSWTKTVMLLDQPRHVSIRHTSSGSEYQAWVEHELRPFLPALAIAHPDGHALIMKGHVPAQWWINLFSRPMLKDHAGPFYPLDTAHEIKAAIARLKAASTEPA